MFFIILVFIAIALGQDPNGCSKAPIRLAGLKYLTRHALNTTAPEVGISDVLDGGHGRMKAFGAPNNLFDDADVTEMRNRCKASYKNNAGLDFDPLTNPNATCIDAVGICTIRLNGTTFATMYPFKEENAFDIRVLFNSKDAHMNCGGYVQVVYMTLVLYSTTGVVETGYSAGQRFVPMSNLGCGWTFYWLKRSNPLGQFEGENNVKMFWLETHRLGYFAPNSFGGSEAKIILSVTDEDGNKGLYVDSQNTRLSWGINGTGPFTRFAHDEFIFPLDEPISSDNWVKSQFRGLRKKRALFK